MPDPLIGRPADFQYHDTYVVVAHFHYVLFSGSIMAIMGAVYFWLPKWTGHMYNETMGKWHFWLTAIFFNITFFPQPDYALQFSEFNMWSSIGAFGLGLTQLLFLYIVVQTVVAARRPRLRSGKGPTAWSGPCPRRRHTIRS